MFCVTEKKSDTMCISACLCAGKINQHSVFSEKKRKYSFYSYR